VAIELRAHHELVRLYKSSLNTWALLREKDHSTNLGKSVCRPHQWLLVLFNWGRSKSHKSIETFRSLCEEVLEESALWGSSIPFHIGDDETTHQPCQHVLVWVIVFRCIRIDGINTILVI